MKPTRKLTCYGLLCSKLATLTIVDFIIPIVTSGKGIMRVGAFFVAVFLYMNCACAQEKSLISAPTPHLTVNLQSFVFSAQYDPLETIIRHPWYWEAKSYSAIPSAAVSALMPKVSAGDDFSPASLKWTFEGKRKLIPVLDLTLLQIKPGEHSPKPASSFGLIAENASFWNKTARTISDMLHE